MTLRPVPRDTENLEILRVYAALDPVDAVGASLRDARRLDEFVERARKSIESSVSMPSRLQGLRAEALFRATLVALGEARLVADEDCGQPYYDDRLGEMAPPDFRVVDGDGSLLLVEVKSVKLKDPLAPFRLPRRRVEAWRRWGEVTGIPVALAVWWVAPGEWTLTSLDTLRGADSSFEIEFVDAIVANEMLRFGDSTLATTPPLVLRLQFEQQGEIDSETGAVQGRISGVEFFGAGRRLSDELERRIAFYFMDFGRWDVQQEAQIAPDGRVASIDFIARPHIVNEEHEREIAKQGFAFVGRLSSLYAGLFDAATLSSAGDVDQLERRPQPDELARLIPDDYWDRNDRDLSLWRFKLQPGDPDEARRRSARSRGTRIVLPEG